MKTIVSLRLATAMAAALGSVAIGVAGTAAADPGNQPVGQPAHFVVTNKSKVSIKFVEYSSSYDNAHSGPQPNFTVQPGQSFGFDITVWDKGGHQTVAKLAAAQGKQNWYVTMKASRAGGAIASCTSDTGCSPFAQTATTDVSLF
jgi:hypothetical protein